LYDLLLFFSRGNLALKKKDVYYVGFLLPKRQLCRNINYRYDIAPSKATEMMDNPDKTAISQDGRPVLPEQTTVRIDISH
jgi:hypothetical protein